MRASVITSVSYDFSLWPHFFRHYWDQVESITFSFTLSPLPLGELIQGQVMSVCERSNGFASCTRAGTDSSGGEGQADDAIRLAALDACTPLRWIIPADLDEFIQFPRPLRGLIDRMEDGGYDYVRGCFRDRLAPQWRVARRTGNPSRRCYGNSIHTRRTLPPSCCKEQCIRSFSPVLVCD